MKLTEKQKRKLARAHRTQEEVAERISIWDTEWWKRRKTAIKAQVEKQEATAKAKAAERRKEAAK